MPGANIPQTELVSTVVIDRKDQWTPVDPAKDLLKSQDWHIRFQRQCLPDLSMGDGRTDVHVNACDLPVAVVLEITYTEPGERGNTATNVMKDATLETGATVKVPLFINTGDKIKVDTRTGEYSERVKD